jgi:signal transduction histidine kinase
MALDIEKYRKEFLPNNIFELLLREVIEQIIKGFFYQTGKAVTLHYAQYDDKNHQWIAGEDARVDPFDFNKMENQKYINIVCRIIREIDNGSRCKECDKEHSQIYFNNWKDFDKIRPIRCWIHLTNIVYPLKIGDNVIAVLIAGQIIPNIDNAVTKIAYTLYNFGKFNIDFTSKYNVNSLIDIISEARRKQWENDTIFATNLINDLKQFGDTLQTIITRLYDARKEKALYKLVNEATQVLAKTDFELEEKWWSCFNEILQDFVALTGFKEARVFISEQGRYRCIFPLPWDMKGKVLIDYYSILNLVPDEWKLFETISFTQNYSQILNDLGFTKGKYDGYLFRGDIKTHDQQQTLSILLVFIGIPLSPYREIVDRFCQNLLLRVVINSMLFFIMKQDKEFRSKVTEIAHNARHPLQHAIGHIETAEHLLDSDVQQSRERLEIARERILFSSNSLREIFIRYTDEPKKRADLIDLIKAEVQNQEPDAKKKNCIIKWGIPVLEPPKPNMEWLIPKKPIWINCNEHQIMVVLLDLLNNAIKYSWSNEEIWIRIKLYTNAVAIIFSNYGIGIPSKDLLKVLEKGYRSRVLDSVSPQHPLGMEREGHGLGLLTVKRIIESHRGTINIESFKPDEGPREHPYHRYVTQVTITLHLVE